MSLPLSLNLVQIVGTLYTEAFIKSRNNFRKNYIFRNFEVPIVQLTNILKSCDILNPADGLPTFRSNIVPPERP